MTTHELLPEEKAAAWLENMHGDNAEQFNRAEMLAAYLAGALEQVRAAVTVRIPVDFNEHDRKGRAYGRLSQADGPVATGGKVLAVEPFDGIAADAVVAEVDEVRGLAWLEVDWHSFRDDPEATEDPACE
ncbi:MAG TPA: hypothetical protein VGG75_38055 [Trebonia sp.]|jgi:hypothetical protein